MSQVAKSASAFGRALLAILELELEDMMVRLVRAPNSPAFMAIVGQFRFGFLKQKNPLSMGESASPPGGCTISHGKGLRLGHLRVYALHQAGIAIDAARPQ